MTNDNRDLSDVAFVETNTETISNELILGFEKIAERKLYAGDPVRAFLLYIASIISQERVLINEAAKMNIPRYAEGEYLDSLCELFKDVKRLAAEPATVTLRFTISIPQESATIIPAGTRVAANDVIFSTDNDVNISAGDTYVDVSATCTTLGTIGNGFDVGQITDIVDVFPLFESVSNTTISNGGADVETDTALYERMRESVENYTTAGSAASYIYHAKTASAMISDVTATSDNSGQVDVRVLCNGGELPTSEILSKVTAALNSDKVRPLTDLVSVLAPTSEVFNVNITYYVGTSNADSLAVINSAIQSAVTKFISWQTAKIGRDINPSYLTQLVMEAGAKRVVVTSPAYTVVNETSVAVVGTTTITNGGVESE